MKILFFYCITIAQLSFSPAVAQFKLPSASPTQIIKQEFGLGNIELTYSRPGAKGHKVFGDLVPYDKLWRTGANAVTKIVFSEPVEMNGRKIDSGAYVLYTIPGAESWEVIINKGIKNEGTDGYKEVEDVLRFKVEPVNTKINTESFTIQFAALRPESCELHLMWEKKLIIIPIVVNIKDKMRTQLEAAMRTNQKPFWQAAQFYYEYDRNLTRALENVNKAIEGNPKAYWILLYKAKIHKDMGDITGATQSAYRSLALSKDAKNDDYVKMNEMLLKELKQKKNR